MTSLLEKTRKINRLLQKADTVEFDGISCILSNVLGANVYIVSNSGKILGYSFIDDFECDIMLDKVVSQGKFPKHYVNWLLKLDETMANVKLKTGKCAFTNDVQCLYSGKNTTIVPIYGLGERQGTLIIAKFDEEFTDDDILLAEYGATVVGMEIIRDHTEKMEEDMRSKTTVTIALSSLSFSEQEAAVHILGELSGKEGLLIASKIADREGITRSVIVNALRKFESAGLIESKSLGMKGTYIRVLNDHLLEEVRKLRR